MNKRPLIAYSIDVAKQFIAGRNGTVALSTDSPEIMEVAEKEGLGAAGYERPAFLATDTAGKIETIADLVQYHEKKNSCRYDYVLDLDVTSPLRTINDLEEAFQTIEADKEALNLFSVSPAARNPYFNMVEKSESGYYGLVKTGNFKTRQSAPAVYDLNASFYFYRRSFFETGQGSTITNKSLVYVVPHLCFDLDHPVDFLFMQYLLETGQLGFEL